jgi:hypothetical protein
MSLRLITTPTISAPHSSLPQRAASASTDSCRFPYREGKTYLAFPRQVVFFEAAAVQRDQEVGATVPVCDGEAGGGHGFS